MHVRGTGAVRLYIQLTPWRYSTEHFGVEFRLPSETNITTGFGSKMNSAQFNIYYYTVGSLFEVSASPVPLRTLVVLCYLVSKLVTMDQIADLYDSPRNSTQGENRPQQGG